MDNVIFITGCSSGIGKALSVEFHRRGYRVIATARNVESLKDLQDIGIRSHGLDVTNPGQIKQVVSEVMEREKKIRNP